MLICAVPLPFQARNILLKSSGGGQGRPFIAKVADFGLSVRIDPMATHVSNVYQVRFAFHVMIISYSW
jgi:hypothetical protein